MTTEGFEQPIAPASRLRSIDVIRGAIMILMAIDHVRVYAGVPAGGPTADLFFTRWITHFCAPGFAFLAGTAIFFHARKLDNVGKLTGFLITRGLLLVILEITVIRFFWAFNIDYSQFFLAGVIWMLGWCMVLMAGLARFRPKTIGIIGLIIILGQQAFHYFPQIFPPGTRESFSLFWNFIYPTSVEMPENIAVLYVIVPWIGVMAAGYGFGLIMALEDEKRRRYCLILGLLLIALFLIIGSIIIFSSATPENPPPFIFRLLNQNKYPASQLFLLMTLGPIIALIPLAEKAKGWFGKTLEIFGRVPMFYYLTHILLIHVSALVVNLIVFGQGHQDWYGMAPFYAQQKEDIRWGLPLMYLVFAIDVAILFVACRWYAGLKKRNPNGWLRFL